MLSIFATVLCNLRNSTSVNARDLSFYGNCQLSLRPQIPAAAAGDRDSGREAAAAGLVTTSDVKTTRPYIAPATRPPTPSSASLLSSWSQSQAKAKGNKNLGSSEQNDVDEKKKVATDDRQSPSQSSLSASSAHNNKPFKPKSRFRNRPSTKSPPSSSRDQQPSSSPRDQHTSSLSRDQKQPLADEPTEVSLVGYYELNAPFIVIQYNKHTHSFSFSRLPAHECAIAQVCANFFVILLRRLYMCVCV